MTGLTPADIGFAVSLPPRDSIAYLKAKGQHISWNWHEVWQEAHAKRFTVAKAARLDILTAIRGEVTKALEKGLTERDFIKTMTPRLQALGWWGKQVIVDPDGAAELVQLGSPRRLSTIYRTNLQTAYMAGRYKAMMSNAKDRPYWMYVAVMDTRTRPAHAAMHGRVFHYSSPIWRTHYPPNGFRCRCRVRALTADQIKSMGLTVESAEGRLDEELRTVAIDKRTGEPLRRPVTIYRFPDGAGRTRGFAPDPGWNYNPGMAWSRYDKDGLLPDSSGGGPALAGGGGIKMLPDQKTWRDHGRPDLRVAKEKFGLAAPSILEPAKDVTVAKEILATALGVSATDPLRTVRTPIEEVAIHYGWLGHLVEKRQDARERFANFVLPTLTDPYEVYLTGYDDDSFRRRYVGLFQGKYSLLVVVRINRDGSLLWNVMHSDFRKLNRQRIGELLFGKK